MLDVIVSVDAFRNVDLVQQGFYRLSVQPLHTPWSPQGEGG